MLANQTIAFIGGGHIAEIIIHNLTQTEVIPPRNLIVSDPAPSKRQHLADQFGVSLAEDNTAAAQVGDLIMICVRPDVVEAVIPDLKAAQLHTDQVVISIAAGIPLSAYKSLGEDQPLVRALPNPPSQVGQGIAPLVFSPAVSKEQRQHVLDLFSLFGKWVEVKEEQINAITSLSSPVATYLFFQSLIEAGVECGLPHPIAEKVAAQTISGSMAVWDARDVSPSQLIQEASTPGGVSAETIRVLQDRRFPPIIIDAITQGTNRAEQLGNKSHSDQEKNPNN